MKLVKAITAHGETVTEITLRTPTGDDVMELGFPFLVSDGGTVPIASKIGRYIVKLAGIPMSSVKQLDAQDMMLAAAEVIGFFGASEPEETTAAPKH